MRAHRSAQRARSEYSVGAGARITNVSICPGRYLHTRPVKNNTSATKTHTRLPSDYRRQHLAGPGPAGRRDLRRRLAFIKSESVSDFRRVNRFSVNETALGGVHSPDQPVPQ